MTDRKELESLMGRMEAHGAIVRRVVINDRLEGIQIANAKGIGSHLMALISAAERMREWLAAHDEGKKDASPNFKTL